jgi:hypothetical protein
MTATIFEVLDNALAKCPGLSVFEFSLAGCDIRVCADTPGLLLQLTEALRHRRKDLAGDPDLTIYAFAKQPPASLERPEWRVAEHWMRRQPVRALNEQGMIYFDSIAEEVGFVDAARSRAAIWFGPDRVLPIWIAAAPFIRILDTWFAARGRILCHGAAIAKSGVAALLIGPGGAGKSTLALHAIDQGFDYIGDDYVLLEPTPSGAIAHSLYCSGKLKQAELTAAMAEMVSVHRAVEDVNEKSFVLPAPKCLRASAPLAMVIEPRFGDGEPPLLEPISSADALRVAAPNVLRQLPGAEQRKLVLLARAFAAPCFRLRLTVDHRRNLGVIRSALARYSPMAKYRVGAA